MPSDDGKGESPGRSVGASPARGGTSGALTADVARRGSSSRRACRSASRSPRGRPAGWRPRARPSASASTARKSSTMSAGYAPRKIGSRNQRLNWPSMRRAASTSAGSFGVDGIGDREVQRDAEVQRRVTRAQLAHGLPVAEQQVVRGEHALGGAVVAGRVHAGGVAQERRAPRLVERRPDVHAVAERVVHVERVLGEPVGGVAVRPAALAPAAPAAGPSGRASARAGCRHPAARRPAACRSRRPRR